MPTQKERAAKSAVQADFWKSIINKYEDRNESLENERLRLQQRVDQMDASVPAVMTYNMAKIAQESPGTDVGGALMPPAGACTCGDPAPPSTTSCPQQPLKLPDMSNISVFSIEAADVCYMEKIKQLTGKEKQLIDEVNKLRAKEKALNESKKKIDDFAKNANTESGGGGMTVKSADVGGMNARLMQENQRLYDEIADVRLEAKHLREQVEGPMQRELERERRRNAQLEAEVQRKDRECEEKHGETTRETSLLRKQLEANEKNVKDMRDINCKLKDEILFLSKRNEQLQTDLINQKLSEATTLARMQADLEKERKRKDLRSSTLCTCRDDGPDDGGGGGAADGSGSSPCPALSVPSPPAPPAEKRGVSKGSIRSSGVVAEPPTAEKRGVSKGSIRSAGAVTEAPPPAQTGIDSCDGRSEAAESTKTDSKSAADYHSATEGSCTCLGELEKKPVKGPRGADCSCGPDSDNLYMIARDLSKEIENAKDDKTVPDTLLQTVKDIKELCELIDQKCVCTTKQCIAGDSRVTFTDPSTTESCGVKEIVCAATDKPCGASCADVCSAVEVVSTGVGAALSSDDGSTCICEYAGQCETDSSTTSNSTTGGNCVMVCPCAGVTIPPPPPRPANPCRIPEVASAGVMAVQEEGPTPQCETTATGCVDPGYTDPSSGQDTICSCAVDMDSSSKSKVAKSTGSDASKPPPLSCGGSGGITQQFSCGGNVTTMTAAAGFLEVVTEGAEGVIETSMVVTEAGNIEVVTEVREKSPTEPDQEAAVDDGSTGTGGNSGTGSGAKPKARRSNEICKQLGCKASCVRSHKSDNGAQDEQQNAGGDQQTLQDNDKTLHGKKTILSEMVVDMALVPRLPMEHIGDAPLIVNYVTGTQTDNECNANEPSPEDPTGAACNECNTPTANNQHDQGRSASSESGRYDMLEVIPELDERNATPANSCPPSSVSPSQISVCSHCADSENSQASFSSGSESTESSASSVSSEDSDGSRQEIIYVTCPSYAGRGRRKGKSRSGSAGYKMPCGTGATGDSKHDMCPYKSQVANTSQQTSSCAMVDEAFKGDQNADTTKAIPPTAAENLECPVLCPPSILKTGKPKSGEKVASSVSICEPTCTKGNTTESATNSEKQTCSVESSVNMPPQSADRIVCSDDCIGIQTNVPSTLTRSIDCSAKTDIQMISQSTSNDKSKTGCPYISQMPSNTTSSQENTANCEIKGCPYANSAGSCKSGCPFLPKSTQSTETCSLRPDTMMSSEPSPSEGCKEGCPYRTKESKPSNYICDECKNDSPKQITPAVDVVFKKSNYGEQCVETCPFRSSIMIPPSTCTTLSPSNAGVSSKAGSSVTVCSESCSMGSKPSKPATGCLDECPFHDPHAGKIAGAQSQPLPAKSGCKNGPMPGCPYHKLAKSMDKNTKISTGTNCPKACLFNKNTSKTEHSPALNLLRVQLVDAMSSSNNLQSVVATHKDGFQEPRQSRASRTGDNCIKNCLESLTYEKNFPVSNELTTACVYTVTEVQVPKKQGVECKAQCGRSEPKITQTPPPDQTTCISGTMAATRNSPHVVMAVANSNSCTAAKQNNSTTQVPESRTSLNCPCRSVSGPGQSTMMAAVNYQDSRMAPKPMANTSTAKTNTANDVGCLCCKGRSPVSNAAKLATTASAAVAGIQPSGSSPDFTLGSTVVLVSPSIVSSKCSQQQTTNVSDREPICVCPHSEVDLAKAKSLKHAKDKKDKRVGDAPCAPQCPGTCAESKVEECVPGCDKPCAISAAPPPSGDCAPDCDGPCAGTEDAGLNVDANCECQSRRKEEDCPPTSIMMVENVGTQSKGDAVDKYSNITSCRCRKYKKEEKACKPTCTGACSKADKYPSQNVGNTCKPTCTGPCSQPATNQAETTCKPTCTGVCSATNKGNKLKQSGDARVDTPANSKTCKKTCRGACSAGFNDMLAKLQGEAGAETKKTHQSCQPKCPGPCAKHEQQSSCKPTCTSTCAKGQSSQTEITTCKPSCKAACSLHGDGKQKSEANNVCNPLCTGVCARGTGEAAKCKPDCTGACSKSSVNEQKSSVKFCVDEDDKNTGCKPGCPGPSKESMKTDLLQDTECKPGCPGPTKDAGCKPGCTGPSKVSTKIDLSKDIECKPGCPGPTKDAGCKPGCTGPSKVSAKIDLSKDTECKPGCPGPTKDAGCKPGCPGPSKKSKEEGTSCKLGCTGPCRKIVEKSAGDPPCLPECTGACSTSAQVENDICKPECTGVCSKSAQSISKQSDCKPDCTGPCSKAHQGDKSKQDPCKPGCTGDCAKSSQNLTIKPNSECLPGCPGPSKATQQAIEDVPCLPQCTGACSRVAQEDGDLCKPECTGVCSKSTQNDTGASSCKPGCTGVCSKVSKNLKDDSACKPGCTGVCAIHGPQNDSACKPDCTGVCSKQKQQSSGATSCKPECTGPCSRHLQEDEHLCKPECTGVCSKASQNVKVDSACKPDCTAVCSKQKQQSSGATSCKPECTGPCSRHLQEDEHLCKPECTGVCSKAYQNVKDDSACKPDCTGVCAKHAQQSKISQAESVCKPDCTGICSIHSKSTASGVKPCEPDCKDVCSKSNQNIEHADRSCKADCTGPCAKTSKPPSTTCKPSCTGPCAHGTKPAESGTGTTCASTCTGPCSKSKGAKLSSESQTADDVGTQSNQCVLTCTGICATSTSTNAGTTSKTKKPLVTIVLADQSCDPKCAGAAVQAADTTNAMNSAHSHNIKPSEIECPCPECPEPVIKPSVKSSATECPVKCGQSGTSVKSTPTISNFITLDCPIQCGSSAKPKPSAIDCPIKCGSSSKPPSIKPSSTIECTETCTGPCSKSAGIVAKPSTNECKVSCTGPCAEPAPSAKSAISDTQPSANECKSTCTGKCAKPAETVECEKSCPGYTAKPSAKKNDCKETCAGPCATVKSKPSEVSCVPDCKSICAEESHKSNFAQVPSADTAKEVLEACTTPCEITSVAMAGATNPQNTCDPGCPGAISQPAVAKSSIPKPSGQSKSCDVQTAPHSTKTAQVPSGDIKAVKRAECLIQCGKTKPAPPAAQRAIPQVAECKNEQCKTDSVPALVAKVSQKKIECPIKCGKLQPPPPPPQMPEVVGDVKCKNEQCKAKSASTVAQKAPSAAKSQKKEPEEVKCENEQCKTEVAPPVATTSKTACDCADIFVLLERLKAEWLESQRLMREMGAEPCPAEEEACPPPPAESACQNDKCIQGKDYSRLVDDRLKSKGRSGPPCGLPMGGKFDIVPAKKRTSRASFSKEGRIPCPIKCNQNSATDNADSGQKKTPIESRNNKRVPCPIKCKEQEEAKASTPPQPTEDEVVNCDCVEECALTRPPLTPTSPCPPAQPTSPCPPQKPVSPCPPTLPSDFRSCDCRDIISCRCQQDTVGLTGPPFDKYKEVEMLQDETCSLVCDDCDSKGDGDSVISGQADHPADCTCVDCLTQCVNYRGDEHEASSRRRRHIAQMKCTCRLRGLCDKCKAIRAELRCKRHKTARRSQEPPPPPPPQSEQDLCDLCCSGAEQIGDHEQDQEAIDEVCICAPCEDQETITDLEAAMAELGDDSLPFKSIPNATADVIVIEAETAEACQKKISLITGLLHCAQEDAMNYLDIEAADGKKCFVHDTLTTENAILADNVATLINSLPLEDLPFAVIELLDGTKIALVRHLHSDPPLNTMFEEIFESKGVEKPGQEVLVFKEEISPGGSKYTIGPDGQRVPAEQEAEISPGGSKYVIGPGGQRVPADQEVEISPGGSKYLIAPDGQRQEISPGGSKYTIGPDGQRVPVEQEAEISPGGSRYVIAPDGQRQVISPGGSKYTIGPDGQRVSPGGSRYVIAPDGQRQEISPGGSKYTIGPDGQRVPVEQEAEISPGGSRYVIAPDGQRQVISPGGSKYTIGPDGQRVSPGGSRYVIAPDGQRQEISPGGSKYTIGPDGQRVPADQEMEISPGGSKYIIGPGGQRVPADQEAEISPGGSRYVIGLDGLRMREMTTPSGHKILVPAEEISPGGSKYTIGPDGQRVSPGGSRYVIAPDGQRQEISPGGSKYTIGPDGQRLPVEQEAEISPGGSRYVIAPDGQRQVISPGGSKYTIGPGGQRVPADQEAEISPGGSRYVIAPDGQRQVISPGGSKYTIGPDGQRVPADQEAEEKKEEESSELEIVPVEEISPGGSKYIIGPDGQRVPAEQEAEILPGEDVPADEVPKEVAVEEVPEEEEKEEECPEPECTKCEACVGTEGISEAISGLDMHMVPYKTVPFLVGEIVLVPGKDDEDVKATIASLKKLLLAAKDEDIPMQSLRTNHHQRIFIPAGRTPSKIELATCVNDVVKNIDASELPFDKVQTTDEIFAVFLPFEIADGSLIDFLKQALAEGDLLEVVDEDAGEGDVEEVIIEVVIVEDVVKEEAQVEEEEEKEGEEEATVEEPVDADVEGDAGKSGVCNECCMKKLAPQHINLIRAYTDLMLLEDANNNGILKDVEVTQLLRNIQNLDNFIEYVQFDSRPPLQYGIDEPCLNQCNMDAIRDIIFGQIQNLPIKYSQMDELLKQCMTRVLSHGEFTGDEACHSNICWQLVDEMKRSKAGSDLMGREAEATAAAEAEAEGVAAAEKAAENAAELAAALEAARLAEEQAAKTAAEAAARAAEVEAAAKAAADEAAARAAAAEAKAAQQAAELAAALAAAEAARVAQQEALKAAVADATKACHDEAAAAAAKATAEQEAKAAASEAAKAALAAAHEAAMKAVREEAANAADAAAKAAKTAEETAAAKAAEQIAAAAKDAEEAALATAAQQAAIAAAAAKAAEEAAVAKVMQEAEAAKAAGEAALAKAAADAAAAKAAADAAVAKAEEEAKPAEGEATTVAAEAAAVGEKPSVYHDALDHLDGKFVICDAFKEGGGGAGPIGKKSKACSCNLLTAGGEGIVPALRSVQMGQVMSLASNRGMAPTADNQGLSCGGQDGQLDCNCGGWCKCPKCKFLKPGEQNINKEGWLCDCVGKCKCVKCAFIKPDEREKMVCSCDGKCLCPKCFFKDKMDKLGQDDDDDDEYVSARSDLSSDDEARKRRKKKDRKKRKSRDSDGECSDSCTNRKRGKKDGCDRSTTDGKKASHHSSKHHGSSFSNKDYGYVCQECDGSCDEKKASGGSRPCKCPSPPVITPGSVPKAKSVCPCASKTKSAAGHDEDRQHGGGMECPTSEPECVVECHAPCEQDDNDLKKLMKHIKCTCARAETVMGPVLEKKGSEFDSTLSALQLALETFDQKCQTKDQMIDALKRELEASEPCDFAAKLQAHTFGDKVQDYDRALVDNRLPRPNLMDDLNTFTQPQTCACEQAVEPPVPDCDCQDDNTALAVTDVRRIGANSILLKWDGPLRPDVIGFEIYINGTLRSRIYSPRRHTAIIDTIDLSANLKIQLYTVGASGAGAIPAVAYYNL